MIHLKSQTDLRNWFASQPVFEFSFYKARQNRIADFVIFVVETMECGASGKKVRLNRSNIAKPLPTHLVD